MIKNPISSHDLLELPPFVQRPHVYLLGAGASTAAFPNGDKNGIKLPVLKNLVEILELEQLLHDASVKPPYEDFENIFAELMKDKAKYYFIQKIESRIIEYFSQMELPDSPTLYDHLIISLREKDVIATFNWDPLLPKAVERNFARLNGKVPFIYFLHGNVHMGYCNTCNVVAPIKFKNCPQCKEALKQMPLMYPVGEKNYSDNICIKKSWENLKRDISNAYLFTVFGYSAPKTDVEAIDLLKDGWGNVNKRNLEQIEFIVRPGSTDNVSSKWNKFIHSHHYEVCESFYSSRSGTFPRRSCEVVFSQFQGNIWVDPKNIMQNLATFDDFDKFLQPIIDAEEKHDEETDLRGLF